MRVEDHPSPASGEEGAVHCFLTLRSPQGVSKDAPRQPLARRPVLALLGLALLLTGGAAPALAQPAYHESFADPRIRTLFYDANRIVRIDAYVGYQMMIQFSPEERVENVAIGDGAAWQITPNKEASLLFLKPIEGAGRTNMTVVTDQHSYLFELYAHPAGAARADAVTYALRFTYPPPPAVAVVSAPPPPAQPQRRNTFYTYTGSRELLPSVVFDDGRFTYFRWPAETSTPAVFAIGADGQESLVNSSWRDGYEAVEMIAPSFRLRDGREVTTVFNDAWRAPLRGLEAPQPHDARTAREAARQAAQQGAKSGGHP